MDARVSATIHGGSQRTAAAAAAQQNQQNQIFHFFSGGIAGAVSKTCTAPLARLTILFQVQGMHYDVSKMSKPCILREAKRIVAEEGFRAFWRGNLVTVAHRLPQSSISFYVFDRYKHVYSVLAQERYKGNFCAQLLGGGLAGVTAASVTYPLDLVRTRIASQTNVIYYRGIGHTLSTIIREEGVLGLYKGLGATLLQVGPSLAISFSVYETLKSWWQTKRPQDSTVGRSLVCGGLSGIASSAVTFPLDLVRRRMQLEGAGGRARVYNTSLLGTFKQILKQEGLRGLYRGILPECCKVFPSVGIIFMTYEMMKIFLDSSSKEAQMADETTR